VQSRDRRKRSFGKKIPGFTDQHNRLVPTQLHPRMAQPHINGSAAAEIILEESARSGSKEIRPGKQRIETCSLCGQFAADYGMKNVTVLLRLFILGEKPELKSGM
jgi:hypothetical protein